METVFLALWFFLPAGAANMAPVLAAKLPGLRNLSYPLDGGRSFRGIRVLGNNKTWRGLIAGMVLATFVLWLQQLVVGSTPWVAELTDLVDYDNLPTLILGPLFGLGALGGDAIESFIKRQRGLPPGKSWFPFDQTDYIIGGALATMPIVALSAWHYLWLILIWFGVHMVFGYAGYVLKLKDQPM